RFLPRDRTARIKASGRAHSTPALIHAKGWPATFAEIFDATPEGFSVRNRVSSSGLASAADYSIARTMPRRLGLGRHQSAERTQSCAVRISASHRRLSLPAIARRLLDEV